jgi:hypothetical protein
MTNHCSDCGAELLEGSKFCTECGKTVEQQQAPPVQPQPPKQEEPQQIIKTPPKKHKSRKKLVIGLLAIVTIVIIVLILIIYFQGNPVSPGNADSRFVGEWEQNTIEGPRQWTFNSDSTLEIYPSVGAMTNGSWKVTDNQLCFYNGVVCYSYVFSYDGNALTLKKIGVSEIYLEYINLTKKGLQGTSETPDVECSSDSATNRIIIESIDANVKWSDIEITTTPSVATWQVQDASNKGLGKIGITATITTFVAAGDNIFVIEPVGDVSIVLTYLPTNAMLGNWTVNI